MPRHRARSDLFALPTAPSRLLVCSADIARFSASAQRPRSPQVKSHRRATNAKRGAAAANTLQLPSTPVVRSDEQPRIREVVRPSPRRVNFAFLVLRASSPHHSIVVTVVLSSSNPSSAGQHQLSLFVDNNYTIGFTAPVYNPTLHIAHSDVRAQPGASFLSFYGPESRTISTLWSYIQTLQTLQTQSPELSNPQFPAPLPA